MTNDEAKKVVRMFRAAIATAVRAKKLRRMAFEYAATVTDVDINLLKDSRRDESKAEMACNQLDASFEVVTPREIARLLTNKPNVPL